MFPASLLSSRPSRSGQMAAHPETVSASKCLIRLNSLCWKSWRNTIKGTEQSMGVQFSCICEQLNLHIDPKQTCFCVVKYQHADLLDVLG